VSMRRQRGNTPTHFHLVGYSQSLHTIIASGKGTVLGSFNSDFVLLEFNII
jgi:hypothetical protein